MSAQLKRYSDTNVSNRSCRRCAREFQKKDEKKKSRYASARENREEIVWASATSLFRAAARFLRARIPLSSPQQHLLRAGTCTHTRIPSAFYGLNSRSECRSPRSGPWQRRGERFWLLADAYAVKPRCHPSSQRRTCPARSLWWTRTQSVHGERA